MTDETATYLELADELAERLVELQPGTRLSSEHELAAEHDVSRITARAALMELESRHLVRRIRGSGTFVALRIPYAIRSGMAPSWSAQVESAGHVPTHRYLSIQNERATATVARSLLLPRGRTVTRIERLSYVDDEVTGSQTSWLPATEVPQLAEAIGDGSLTRTLIETFGFAPERWWSRAELATVPADIAKRLELTGRGPAWHIESVNRCTRTHRPIEVTIGWMRADAFRVFLEMGPSDGLTPGVPR